MPRPPRSGHEDEHRRGNRPRSPWTVPSRAPGTRTIRSVLAWEKALERYLAPVQFSAVGEEPFHARLRARDLDVVRLVHLEVQPHRLHGRPSEASPSYQFFLPVTGSINVAQEGRRALVEAAASS